jgi:hypothetical protein
MAFVTTEDRVDRLEALFGQFMTEMLVLNKKADERNKEAEERSKAADERMSRLEAEMLEFKDEMREFKDEMREFKDEMHEFKDEMHAFKDEMREFKDEMRQSKKDLDKKWGDLSNKLGTIVEDVLIPNLPRLAVDHFHFADVIHVFGRYNRKSPKDKKTWQEFDALIIGPESLILGEAKSSPSIEYAEQFAKKIVQFREFFPEYKSKKVIPVFGSWSIHPTVKDRLTALGIYGMEMGEDTMQLTNAKALDKKYVPSK